MLWTMTSKTFMEWDMIPIQHLTIWDPMVNRQNLFFFFFEKQSRNFRDVRDIVTTVSEYIKLQKGP